MRFVPHLLLRVYLCVDIIVTFVYFCTYASLLFLSEWFILSVLRFVIALAFIMVYKRNVQIGQRILFVFASN